MFLSYVGLFPVKSEESEGDSSSDGDFSQAQGSWVADFVLALLRCSELQGSFGGLVGRSSPVWKFSFDVPKRLVHD
eukprot:6945488-Pyramimonas_sp.AAC.1